MKVNDIVAIKLKISAKHYENIQNKIQEKEHPFYVCECDAITWLEECTLTQVSKFELDEQRQNETNNLDQMQNTNFLYHPESLIEMQIICSLSVYFFLNLNKINEQI